MILDATLALRDISSVAIAARYIESHGRIDGELRILRHWRGDFYKWGGEVYQKCEPEEFKADVFTFMKGLKVNKKGRIDVFKPEPRDVKATIETLSTECQARVDRMPAWMEKHRPDPSDIVAFKNGLLDLSEANKHQQNMLTPPTPLWFSTLVLPYEFNSENTCPQWIAFLNSTLRKNGGVDRGSIALLQEWFGYCMTADTRHQKLLLLVGPPRCGKGTIIRALQRLVGHANCASPQFSSLNQTFGLEPLLGKRVACIPDAHLGRDDNAVGVLDKILQISGEDSVTVNRKYKPAIPEVRLGVRFTIGANETPSLPDSSGAIITRLLMIQFCESFVGREDLVLENKLSPETPGIALWAMEGLKRLRKTGKFTEPGDSESLRNDYVRQTAPIQAFIQDKCELGSSEEHTVAIDDLWKAWKVYAKENGNSEGTKEGLGKRLRTAVPTLYRAKELVTGERGNKVQQPVYRGLKLVNDDTLSFY